MNRRVRRRVVKRGKQKVDFPRMDENLTLSEEGMLDWTRLPGDTVIQLFSRLSYHDRVSLASTCRTWRAVAKSPCLWQVLDLRFRKCDAAAASALASCCTHLQKLRFRGPESVDAIINLCAKNLRVISGDYCKKMTDAALCVLVARHEALECLQIGPDFCERISSDAVKAIAMCCPQLQKLHLSGIREVDADAINALGKNCRNLMDLGFFDCRKVNETALGSVASVCYLSVAGTTNLKWDMAVLQWSKLPHLIGLDVSRTDFSPSNVSTLFSSTHSLKVLCALKCPAIDRDPTCVSYDSHKGKVLLTVSADILKGVAKLFVDSPKNNTNVFLHRRTPKKDMKSDEILNWLEWVILSSLLRLSESNSHGLDNFWIDQGATLLLGFLQSTREEVQERAATALATFVVVDDEYTSINPRRAEAVIRADGIRILLNLAELLQEGPQSEATKAIANLSINPKVAKTVADEGGITILANLARSNNRLVAEEAAGALWNLSVGEEHKGAIAKAGGVKGLVDLIYKWSSPTGSEGVLERAAGALANLAADNKCSMEVASLGGVRALVSLARHSKVEGAQEQAARALANLAAHGDSNNNNAAVGQEAGAIDALVQLIRSSHDGVRQEAAGALWNLSFDDRNREAIATAGGVQALVALARSCSTASTGLQERAAGALWGLSVSETNSIAIGQEGGVGPLIAFAQSDAQDVHETAAGALWNLAFNPGNALHIVDQGGVQALAHLCSSSTSKMARFMSALALTYMFDGRIDEIASIGTSKVGILVNARRVALKHIEAFVASFIDPSTLSAAVASSAPAALAHVMDSLRIHEAGHLRCSGAEIGRFVGMLRNPSPTLKSCAAFALLQFSIPSGRHAAHHVKLLQNALAPRVLRGVAASAGAALEAKVFARIVLRNLEQHPME